MNPNRSVTLVHAKDHPVLERPLEWRVQEVRLRLASAGAERVRVEIVLFRDRRRRELRFDGVADFALSGPIAGGTLRVLDVTHLQWRGIDLRVESACGSLCFWAATVSDEGAVDRTEAREPDAAPQKLGATAPPARGRSTPPGRRSRSARSRT